jgi:phosphatidylserine decarboxylase
MSVITSFRSGNWLPRDHHLQKQWLETLIDEVRNNPEPLRPVMEEFRKTIENDPQIFMLFHLMFDQVPKKPPYDKDPTGQPQVRDYLHMLDLINAILVKAPEFNKTGLVGFPINAILDWPMGTEAGFTAFLNEKVNFQFMKVLNAWGVFLSSKDSCYVLGTDPHHGWFGSDAQQMMPDFDKDFVCDPGKPYHGFTSWDDFFTRQFRPGIRPVADTSDDNVIVNACESTPYKIAHHVQKQDRFWLKAQPYSLSHMLADDPLAPRFEGGTIYQAFLSALSYHRWHSPVSGTILKAYTLQGTYYSETLSEGFDAEGPNLSQGYITEVATRAFIYIESDNPRIGLICFVAVGMAEVSTCQITVYEGQHVNKGEELGMFHFGGSTHCLLFRPEVKLEFDLHGQTIQHPSHNIPVNARIAQVCQ